MTARMFLNGRPAIYKDNIWVDEKTGEVIKEVAECKTCGNIAKEVEVTISAEQSHTREERKEIKPIDSCISPIVEALENAGIKMTGSCCGHKLLPGCIRLDDGRILGIFEEKHFYEMRKLFDGREW